MTFRFRQVSFSKRGTLAVVCLDNSPIFISLQPKLQGFQKRYIGRDWLCGDRSGVARNGQ